MRLMNFSLCIRIVWWVIEYDIFRRCSYGGYGRYAHCEFLLKIKVQFSIFLQRQRKLQHERLLKSLTELTQSYQAVQHKTAMREKEYINETRLSVGFSNVSETYLKSCFVMLNMLHSSSIKIAW